jgi:hypothetical protein
MPRFGTGQIIRFEKIDVSKVTPWIPKMTIEYQHGYHFGDLEMESDFIFFFELNRYY